MAWGKGMQGYYGASDVLPPVACCDAGSLHAQDSSFRIQGLWTKS